MCLVQIKLDELVVWGRSQNIFPSIKLFSFCVPAGAVLAGLWSLVVGVVVVLWLPLVWFLVG